MVTLVISCYDILYIPDFDVLVNDVVVFSAELFELPGTVTQAQRFGYK